MLKPNKDNENRYNENSLTHTHIYMFFKYTQAHTWKCIIDYYISF